MSREVSGGGLAHLGHTPSTSGFSPSRRDSGALSSANVRRRTARRSCHWGSAGHDWHTCRPGRHRSVTPSASWEWRVCSWGMIGSAGKQTAPGGHGLRNRPVCGPAAKIFTEHGLRQSVRPLAARTKDPRTGGAAPGSAIGMVDSTKVTGHVADERRPRVVAATSGIGPSRSLRGRRPAAFHHQRLCPTMTVPFVATVA